VKRKGKREHSNFSMMFSKNVVLVKLDSVLAKYAPRCVPCLPNKHVLTFTG
jgi:hypothetical protein